MAQRDMLTVSNRWFAQLNASVTTGATSWILKSSGATGISAPCYVHCDAEIAKVTAIATDTPSAGLDTLTVERAQNSTTATTHDADAAVGQFYYSAYHDELAERLATIEFISNLQAGNASGIVRPPTNSLLIKEQSTPSMTVDVKAGAAYVNGQPVSVRADTTLGPFTAPSTNPRIDTIEIDQYGTVSAVTGTEAASPSAPSVTSGNLKLAEIYHTTAETSIKDANDATNGYITDSRSAAFL